MKKILSLAIAVLIAFSCTFTALAAVDVSATPDEITEYPTAAEPEEDDEDDSAGHDYPFASTGEELYEVVSITPGKLYYTKADIESSYKYDGKTYYWFIPDIKGTKITIKDTKSGKQYTAVIDGTESFDGFTSDVGSLDEPNQIIPVSFIGDVDDIFGITTPTGYNKNVEFYFNVYYNYQSTNDTATKDAVTPKNDNGAVQTGSPMTAVSVALVMLVASGAMFVCYRKKVEK